MHTYMHACMHTYIHTHIHTHTHTLTLCHVVLVNLVDVFTHSRLIAK